MKASSERIGGRASLLAAFVASVAWAACATQGGGGDGEAGRAGSSQSGGGAGQSAGGAGGSGPGGAAGLGGGPANGSGGSAPVGEGGLPCDVQTFLTAQCNSCHSDPPRNNAPMALTSRAALVATDDSGATFAARSLAELKEGAMPPGNALSAADFKAFEDWVNAGAPEGSCEPVDDPFDDLPACSSGQTAAFCGEDFAPSSAIAGCADAQMNPGMACGGSGCHDAGGEGPRIWFAGTVYRSGHEPDLCIGGPASGQAEIVVTGADGATVTRKTNDAGNFVLLRGDLDDLAFPIRAEVRYEGRVRAMAAPQESGDCNSCHTRDGSEGAPGRIALP